MINCLGIMFGLFNYRISHGERMVAVLMARLERSGPASFRIAGYSFFLIVVISRFRESNSGGNGGYETWYKRHIFYSYG